MLKFLVLITLPIVVQSVVQCYVGQKLFAYESTNAICAKFIPYTCATSCEWKKSCKEHASFNVFRGRRTFVSGLLLNSKSLMVLCCASLSTRLETDNQGREKCVWRDTESISVLGPSIRTNPVLAPNHYIRDIRLERDGNARVDVTLEVCQYTTEVDHCDVEKMTPQEQKRFNFVTNKLQKVSPKESRVTKTGGDEKTIDSTAKAGECSIQATTDCGRNLQSQITACCKDRPACEHDCLKAVETTLGDISPKRGCTSDEIKQSNTCLSQLVNTHV